ncbi:Cytochrome c [Methylobacterium sp. 190mf]|uniref:cytochrome c n=1 Tax=Methylobacterium sp. 190mf TaxID=1761798 RepID=UPI00089E7A66|nr:cytochrome c [Methylobacterium sp. 190mf]SEG67445.1 Cytochrome c [Methylobacterium sp. 190mf]
MKHPRILKAGLGVALLGLVGLGATYAAALWPTETRRIADQRLDGALIEAGRYVATASDCVACHTAPGGKPFAGGLPMETPIGRIFSTNITPDRETGIGAYGLDDFDRAIRHGIVPGGTTLFPAMPYPSYARLTDEDVRALYAFFMQGVEPVREARRANEITWPLSIRWPLALWRKAFARSGEAAFDPGRYANPQVARGAYLVQAAGHCGACHTPRALTLQEKALDETDQAYLSGGQVVDGWFAVSLRGEHSTGLGRWSADDIVQTLRGGRNRGHAVVGGPMNDVVVHSTQHLDAADLQAIAIYLKTLAAGPTTATYAPDGSTARDLARGHEAGRGAELYVDNCAACHRTDGLGVSGAFPTIAGNPTVHSADPVSLIRLILDGSVMASTHAAPSNLGMPGFGWRLSDEEVAHLATFVRQSWGNAAGPVSASFASNVRRALRHERNRDDYDVQRQATSIEGR